MFQIQSWLVRKRVPEHRTAPAKRIRQRADARKGSALVFSVVLVAGLLIVTAIAVDYGHINTSRSEVKRTADAAAMSACWELYDSVLSKQSGAMTQSAITGAATSIAAKNEVSSRSPQVNGASDVLIGYYDLQNPGHLDQSQATDFNAVRVHVRQTEGAGSAIPLFFGAVTGRPTQSLQAHSTAAMYKSITGFHSPGDSGECIDILPIALDLETWEKVVAGETGDNLCIDSQGNVVSGQDEYHECSLYPDTNIHSGSGYGASGNRGTVDIGGANNSTSDLKRQILEGISAQDLADLGKELECHPTDGLELNGDTGISAGIKAALTEIIGQPRIIPIFETVSGNGNNAMYKIVRWEGIKILEVKLTGPMKKKHVTIQPCPIVCPFAKYDEAGTTSSEFLFTPVMLVE